MSYRLRISDLKKRVKQMAEALAVFQSDAVLEDLVRRGQHKASDGYPGQSIPEFVSSSAGNPTMTKATQEKELIDRLGDALADMDAELLSARASLLRARHCKEYVENIGYQLDRVTLSLSTCDCCGRDVANTPVDRIKGGLCPACYTALGRARLKNPDLDKARFIHDRRAELAEQEVRRRHVS